MTYITRRIIPSRYYTSLLFSYGYEVEKWIQSSGPAQRISQRIIKPRFHLPKPLHNMLCIWRQDESGPDGRINKNRTAENKQPDSRINKVEVKFVANLKAPLRMV